MNIKHDIHTHTLQSSCCYDRLAVAGNYVRKAQELGHTVLGICNHLWDETVPGASRWYEGQPASYVLQEKPLIRSLRADGLRILYGAEVEYCGKTDTLALTARTAEQFDYVQIPHTHTHMKGFVIPEYPALLAFREEFCAKLQEAFPWMKEQTAVRLSGGMSIDELESAAKTFGISYNRAEYERFVAEFLVSSLESLIANPEFEKITRTVPVVIAHPLSPTEQKESRARIFDMTDKERMRNCCRTLAGMGVAFDVNMCTFTAPEENWKNDPMVKTMQIAKECGIRFTFGTDAHSLKALEEIRKADRIADAIGITGSDLAPLVCDTGAE